MADKPVSDPRRDSDADLTRLSAAAEFEADFDPVATRIAERSLLIGASEPVSDTGPEQFKPGDRIDNRYEVLAIHKGSMGVVYATFDHNTRLPRALKTLQRRYSRDRRMVELFYSEAALWVRLEKHPFIVRADLVERFAGQPYVITEYVRGPAGRAGDLRGWIGLPSLSLAVRVEMALQIAQGMQHAVHRVPGLVHRDLKPANVLVNDRGQALVTDFGLAAARGLDGGTPAYMSPEQWSGEEVDQRSDIYAYGCMLYELFTQHRLYPARTLEEWKAAHLRSAPHAPRSLNGALPADREAFLLSCLHKDRSRRPGTWDEVVHTCAAWFQQLTGQPAVLDYSAYRLDVEELTDANYSLFQLGRHTDALLAADRALAIDSKHVRAWVGRGASLSNLGRLEDALAAYDRVIAIDSNHSHALFGRGVVLGQMGRWGEAVVAYDRSLVIDPKHSHAWTNKGVALGQMGLFTDAVGALDRSLAIDPDGVPAWVSKGTALLRLGRVDQAVSAFDHALTLDANISQAWFGKAGALKQMRRFADAVAAYDMAITLNPNSSEAWFGKGVALGQLGRWADSLTAYDQVLLMNPGDAQAWCNKADCLGQLGQWGDALAACDRAVGADPNYSRAWFGRGVVLGRLEQWAEALAAYDRALAIDAHSLQTWFNKGFVLLQLGQWAEAVVACDRALALDLNHSQTWFVKGVALEQLGQWSDALAAFDQYLAFDPNASQAWCNKGIALEWLGRGAEALAAYDRSLAIDPNDTTARNNRESLRQRLKL